MAKFLIRFFVSKDAIDDVVDADNLADAVGQAQVKLASASFTVRDERGNPGMTISQGQVKHITVMDVNTYKALTPTVLRVERGEPRPRSRPKF